MKLNRHNQDFLARRADQARLAKQSAANIFRNHRLDLTIQRLLKNCEQTTQEICNPAANPTGDAGQKTGGVDTEAG